MDISPLDASGGVPLDARQGTSPFGWNGPVRGLLVISLMLGVALEWIRGDARQRSGETAAPRLVVNLNDAPAAVLQTLPKVGPARVGAILQARRVRPFRSLDDFDERVRGIGPATRNALEPFVRISPPADVVE